jgi:hypothetical protein
MRAPTAHSEANANEPITMTHESTTMNHEFFHQQVLSDHAIAIADQYGAASTSTALLSGYRVVSTNSFSSYDSDATIEIPDRLNSAETLEFCGFESSLAADVYSAWARYQGNARDGDINFGEDIIIEARYYIHKKEDQHNAWGAEQNWHEALTGLGCSSSMRMRIMDDAFEQVRLTDSAAAWFLDTVEIAWRFLAGLDRTIKKKQRRNDDRMDSPDPLIPPSKATKPSLKTVINQSSSSSSSRIATEVDVPNSIEGKQMLFKGGDMNRLLSIFKDDGTLNLVGIASTPPTDFHPFHPGLLYFSKQKEVAYKYAGFALARVPPAEGAIMQVAIPSSLLSSAREVFGSEWRDMVWHSRNARVHAEEDDYMFPQRLHHLQNSSILIGEICGQGSHQIRRMHDPSELTAMRLDCGRKASQVVLQSPGVRQGFRAACQGFVWVSALSRPEKGFVAKQSP